MAVRDYARSHPHEDDDPAAITGQAGMQQQQQQQQPEPIDDGDVDEAPSTVHP